MKGNISMEVMDTGDGLGMKCKCTLEDVGIVDKALLFKQLKEMLEVDPIEMAMIRGILDSGMLEEDERQEHSEDFDLEEELKKMGKTPRTKSRAAAQVHAVGVDGPDGFRKLMDAILGGGKK